MAYKKKNKSDSESAKSGAKLYHKLGSDKGLYIWAWKKVGTVMWKISVFRSKEQGARKPVKSEKGDLWCGVTVKCSAMLHNDVIVTGMLNLSTYNVHIDGWGAVILPKAKNGGYFGQKPNESWGN